MKLFPEKMFIYQTTSGTFFMASEDVDDTVGIGKNALVGVYQFEKLVSVSSEVVVSVVPGPDQG